MERVLRDGAFAGETHIVSGAGQGIGRRTAGALAAHGAAVVLVDLDEGHLLEAADEIKALGLARPLVCPANVTSESDVQGVVATALAETGRVNGVVNVAGITRDARIARKSLEDFQQVLAVHLHGTFLFTREVAAQHWHPLFKQNGNQPLRDGVNRFIVNVSSVSARKGNVGQVDYTAAKGAIEAMTRTTAAEFASYGVRVNAIAPGPIDTPMLSTASEEAIQALADDTLLGRIGTPDEIAHAICAIADPKLFGYATAQIFGVNGGGYSA